MKAINVHFDDKEYKALVKLKGELSWHDFIITLKEVYMNNGK